MKRSSIFAVISLYLSLTLALGLASGCSKTGEEHTGSNTTSAQPPPYMTVEDDAGRNVTLPSKPLTVVSLAPSVSDMLVALGETGKLRGVTVWNDRAEAENVERIGDLINPDLERIISLKPDVVMGTEMTPRHVYDTLSAASIPCLMFKHQGLNDVMDDMRTMSLVLGDKEQGERVLLNMQRRISKLKKQIEAQGTKGLKVALLYDIDSMGSAGKGSWIDDMLTEIGLDNIASRAASTWPRLSKEALISEQPDFIILPLPLDPADNEAFMARIASLKSDPVWQSIKATEDHIVFVPGNYLNIPGARTLEAMELIARRVYGLEW